LGKAVREQLRDSKIAIKKIVPGYVPLLFQAVFESREILKVWLPWCHSDYKIEETIDWVNFQQTAWKDKSEFSFGIFEVNSNRFIGGCGINQINWMYKIGNVGYWIRADATGKGYASAAAKLCAEFGFIDLQLNRIEIVAAKDNIASLKVAEKTGAAKECLARNRLIVGDKVHDAFIYSLIKEDILKN
jgi:RimJ/RimL family protein N-acetyltransferase